jgi:hypothetical protein
MSVQKSIQSLIVSGLVITSLIRFSSSVAFSQEQNTQESIKTKASQNTTNTIKEATRPNYCPLYRRCG